MQRRVTSVIVVALAAFSVSLGAQKTTELGKGGGGSPHVKSDWTIDGANISITYGRPSLKGRTPGKDIDPFDGKPWRTGADEATLLTTDKPLKLGNIESGAWHLHVEHAARWAEVAADCRQGRQAGAVGYSLPGCAGNRSGADDRRQGGAAGRDVDDFGSGHSRGRHAEDRLGCDERKHSFHCRVVSTCGPKSVPRYQTGVGRMSDTTPTHLRHVSDTCRTPSEPTTYRAAIGHDGLRRNAVRPRGGTANETAFLHG